MKEFVVMSGKGGTGKTSITAALGVLAGSQAVVADCDVDAANMHLLYQPESEQRHEFWSGKTAGIDQDLCTACGICQEKCRFDAIDFDRGRYIINEDECEGCSVCHHLCPEHAIAMRDNLAGTWSRSRSRFGNWLIHAKLGIGEENSGKLVAMVKSEARKLAGEEGIPYVIVDGPPGVGCPVISSFSGISHVLLVTEATVSGYHDLLRVMELVEYFKAEASCVINKWDINEEVSRRIEDYCRENGVQVITKITFRPLFSEALREGKTLVEMDDPEMNETMTQIWNHLKQVDGQQ